jgi:hypothetical protein
LSTQQSYPLSWPASWPRYKSYRTSSRFGKKSMETAAYEIYRQLKLLGCGDWNVIISTNVELRRDGIPYSNAKRPTDPGAAVYFKIKEKPQVLACDRWVTVEENLWSIAMHIDAIRAQARWGVGSVEQAFAGYTALPPAGSSPGTSWWNVLGCAHDAPLEAVKDAYREAARKAHPDNGGSHDAMVAVNGAWDQARKAFEGVK